MTFHIRDAVALTKGKYVCYLNGLLVDNLDEVLRNGYEVVAISNESDTLRFDIRKMAFTKLELEHLRNEG